MEFHKDGLNIISKDEYRKIYDSEKEIFNQMVDDYELVLDETGDLIINKDGSWMKGAKVIPQPIIVSDSNLFPELNGIDNTMDIDSRNWFSDVFHIDEEFLNGNYNPLILAYFENGRYQGSVWCTVTNKYVIMYGIKTSLYNYITETKGYATKILHAIEENLMGRKLIILSPLESMVSLLVKNGYIEKIDQNHVLDSILDYPHSYVYYAKNLIFK